MARHGIFFAGRKVINQKWYMNYKQWITNSVQIKHALGMLSSGSAFNVMACNVYRISIELTQLINSIDLHLCLCLWWAHADPLFAQATIKIDISVDRHADRKNGDIDHQWERLEFVTSFQRFIKGLFCCLRTRFLFVAPFLFFYSIKSTIAAIASRPVILYVWWRSGAVCCGTRTTHM